MDSLEGGGLQISISNPKNEFGSAFLKQKHSIAYWAIAAYSTA